METDPNFNGKIIFSDEARRILYDTNRYKIVRPMHIEKVHGVGFGAGGAIGPYIFENDVVQAITIGQ